MTSSTDPTGSGDAARLVSYVETWHRACADLVALARSIDEEDANRPTDLVGWNVRDVLAHTAHLEAVLAGASEETCEVPEAPHVKGPMNVYTEQGVIARRGCTVSELAEEIETSVQRRYAALQADPPTDGTAAPPVVFAGMAWDNERLLGNRPLDVWMHEQDVRRALDRPGGFDSPAAAHTIRVFGNALPLVLGKRVAPEPGTAVRVEVPDAGCSWTVVVGEDGRARFDHDIEPGATITLSAADFIVLAGGRRGPETTGAQVSGDETLGQTFLARMAITP